MSVSPQASQIRVPDGKLLMRPAHHLPFTQERSSPSSYPFHLICDGSNAGGSPREFCRGKSGEQIFLDALGWLETQISGDCKNVSLPFTRATIRKSSPIQSTEMNFRATPSCNWFNGPRLEMPAP